MAQHESRPTSIKTSMSFIRSIAEEARAMTEAERVSITQKDDAIIEELAKLSVLYWRPDFTPGAARQFYLTYLEDLRDYSLKSIRNAVVAYRRNPESKFFPLPGQLLGLIETPPSWWVSGKNQYLTEQRATAADEMVELVSLVERHKLLGKPQK